MVEFGKRLRELRKQKNLTQKQLAALLGLQNSVISFYELGDRMPSPEVIVKLASSLHVSADYLMGIEKQETIDVSDLSDDDIQLVRNLVDSLRLRSQNNNKK